MNRGHVHGVALTEAFAFTRNRREAVPRVEFEVTRELRTWGGVCLKQRRVSVWFDSDR